MVDAFISNVLQPNFGCNSFSGVPSYVEDRSGHKLIPVIYNAHNSISKESGYVEDPPGHLDSSWTTSGSIQICGLGGEAQ
ncbi:hypothetical protein CFP56_002932 [Quercus suber]|uniref:Uncharacterized protein n=1 Tax=Quercus suber TaxID=58331 RepID=A0AAW0IK71_QUESU